MRTRWPWLGGAAILLAAVVLPQALAAPASIADPDLVQARHHQEKAEWLDACISYEKYLAHNRADTGARAEFRTCLRHLHQARRHRERAFRDVLLRLRDNPTRALDVYEAVLGVLASHYIDPDKVEAGKLFQQGVNELRFALDDPVFVRDHLGRAKIADVEKLRALLNTWDKQGADNPKKARQQLEEIARAANQTARLQPVVSVLEFVCGACNGLDEYSGYLTPGQMAEAHAQARGRAGSIGILVDPRRLIVTHVFPDGPAANYLRVNARILSIDGKPADALPPGVLEARLQGPPGTFVGLKVLLPGEMAPQDFSIERRAIAYRSVEFRPDVRDGVGYVRILCFHGNTVTELKDAILRLQAAGMKSLVLDLRGNGGGLLRPAIQVAEMFLPEGVIVNTHSRLRGERDLNETHRAHNPNALTMPLVVLVDGDTASSAEILAGALKENGRAKLIGQTTYGKASIQWVVTLRRAEVQAGIRITVARFVSPAGQSYNGRGITPDRIVLDLTGENGEDLAAQIAEQEARNLLPMPMPMLMMNQ